MGIHSKILVHWTGKHIENSHDNNKAQKYVERLKDYYQNGLFAKITIEDVIRHKKIKNIIRLCFTEIRLSQAQTHAERYGKLGIGFTRDFIMNKGGRPVIYIPFDENLDGRLLEDSIKSAFENSEDNKEVHKSLQWIIAHVKRMSNVKSENREDYKDNYEEMEWRLVYDENPNNKHFTKAKGEANGIRRLKVNANDIEVIIFPDEGIREMSLKDEVIRKYFSEHMPILATLEDCSNF